LQPCDFKHSALPPPLPLPLLLLLLLLLLLCRWQPCS
jgi:hypothetical protein